MGDHLKCRPPDRPKVGVGVGNGRDEGRLEELSEPLLTYAGRSEYALEGVVERPQVEQRLVDVEDEDATH
jgi:hypothetical protein